MRKLSIEFSGELTLPNIEEFYSNVQEAIRARYSDSINSNYLSDFLGRTQTSVDEERDRAYAELEKEATMCLLSYMESAFRTDFVMRCDLKKKDKLSLLFRKSYDRNKRKYQYGFNDVVIKGWKEIYPEHKTEFDRIVEMMNYRNWLAHGRYWKFKDNIAKYSYSAVHNAIESLENAFQSVIMRPSLIGEAVSDGI